MILHAYPYAIEKLVREKESKNHYEKYCLENKIIRALNLGRFKNCIAAIRDSGFVEFWLHCCTNNNVGS